MRSSRVYGISLESDNIDDVEPRSFRVFHDNAASLQDGLDDWASEHQPAMSDKMDGPVSGSRL